MTMLSMDSPFLLSGRRAIRWLVKLRRALRVTDAVVTYWDRRITRAALYRLDDRMLTDIGVPRSSIDYAATRVGRSHMRRLFRF